MMADNKHAEENRKQEIKLQNDILMNKVGDVDSTSENKSIQDDGLSENINKEINESPELNGNYGDNVRMEGGDKEDKRVSFLREHQ